jgi:hypothetical protein
MLHKASENENESGYGTRNSRLIQSVQEGTVYIGKDRCRVYRTHPINGDPSLIREINYHNTLRQPSHQAWAPRPMASPIGASLTRPRS